MSLQDDASAGLANLRTQITQLTASAGQVQTAFAGVAQSVTQVGSAATQAHPRVKTLAQELKELEKSAEETTRGLLHMGLSMRGGVGALPELALGAREAYTGLKGLTSGLTALGPEAQAAALAIGTVAIAGTAVVAALGAASFTLFNFATGMSKLNDTAKTLGTNFADLKHAIDWAEKFDVAAETIISNYNGIAQAQANLARNDSQLRQHMMQRGLDPIWLQQFGMEKDPAKATAMVQAQGLAIERQLLATGRYTQMAARAQIVEFARDLGQDAGIYDRKPPPQMSEDQKAQLDRVGNQSAKVREIWGEIYYDIKMIGIALADWTLTPLVLVPLQIIKGIFDGIKWTIDMINRGLSTLGTSLLGISKYLPIIGPLIGLADALRKHGGAASGPEEGGAAATPGVGKRTANPLAEKVGYRGDNDNVHPMFQNASFTQDELVDETGKNTSQTERLTAQIIKLNDYLDRGGGGGGGGFQNASYSPEQGLGGPGLGGRGGGRAAGAAGFGGGGYTNLGGGNAAGRAGIPSSYSNPSGGDHSNPTSSTPAETSSQTVSGAQQGGLKAGSAAGGGGPLKAGAGGKVDSTSFYNAAVERFKNSPLNGYVPKDGDKWGIKTGSPEEWARLATATAQQESGLNANVHGGGLFQMESGDLARYGQGGKSVNDPQAQLDAAAKQWETAIPKAGVVAQPGGGPGSYSGWRGAGAYFGSMRSGPGSGHGAEPDIAKYMRPGGFADKVAANAGAQATQTAAAQSETKVSSADANQIFSGSHVAGTVPKSMPGSITGESTTAGTNPDGSPLPDRVQAVGGDDPKAFITHHTGGGGTPDGVRATLRQRGLGVEYIMDQQGNIVSGQGGQGGHGGAGAAHMLPSGMYDDRGGKPRKVGDFPEGDPRRGLTNQNVVGMEIIASDDPHVKKIQAQKYAEFMAKRYPTTNIYGHGEVNVGHKEKDEGLTAKRAALALRAQGGNSAVATGASGGGYPSEWLDRSHQAPGALNLPLPQNRSGTLRAGLGGDDLDRASLDRAALSKAMEINSRGNLSVDVKAPAGSKVDYSGDNLLKPTKMQRATAMQQTPSGPNVSDTAAQYMGGRG